MATTINAGKTNVARHQLTKVTTGGQTAENLYGVSSTAGKVIFPQVILNITTGNLLNRMSTEASSTAGLTLSHDRFYLLNKGYWKNGLVDDLSGAILMGSLLDFLVTIRCEHHNRE